MSQGPESLHKEVHAVVRVRERQDTLCLIPVDMLLNLGEALKKENVQETLYEWADYEVKDFSVKTERTEYDVSILGFQMGNMKTAVFL